MEKPMNGFTVVLSIVVLLFVSVATGCVAIGKYKAVSNPAELRVSFVDMSWDGKRVPKGQQCNRDNGEGATPPIVVDNIPAGANAIIMEFSDASSSNMNFGGHGKIGYRIPKNKTRVTIPSVAGHTFDLPNGFFMVAAHVNPAWDKAGAYLPPCSGGRGNRYYVTVKAVYDAPKGEQSTMLGKAKLQMGTY